MSATLPVELDRESSEPLYRQIESFVRAAIDAGGCAPVSGSRAFAPSRASSASGG